MSIAVNSKNHEKNWAELPKVRYINRGNFINDNYLESFESDTASNWLRTGEAKLDKAWREAQHIYKKVRNELKPGMHEPGELDPKLILPILQDVLGFSQRKKKFTPPNHDTQIEPDHLLFDDPNIASRFWEEDGKKSRDLRTIVAICESKTWDQPLDIRKSAKELSPHEQVMRDFRLTGAHFAILTNGNKWRVYSKDSLDRAAHYFEMSLPLMCESEDPDLFEIFYNFFSAEALSEKNGPSHLSKLQAESQRFGSKLENSLRVRMYSAVEFLLSGLHQNDATEDLNTHYKNAILLMYRVLFLLKAEDGNLLPLRSSSKYPSHSLRSICDEATRLVSQWDLGKEATAKEGCELIEKLAKLSRAIDKGNADFDVNTGFNGGLFSDMLNPNIFKTKISNYHLANALYRCTRIPGADPLKAPRVNFDSVNYQHIGSVYEGLLEFVPTIATSALQVIASDKKFDVIAKSKGIPSGFELLRAVSKGDVYLDAEEEARKNSGSYYTPQWLVSSTLSICGLLGRINECKTIDELSAISVCDPAMGSGHFLIEAAEHVVRKAQSLYIEGTKETLDEFVEHAVLSTIYGSDRNELAVMLARLNIWLILSRKDRSLPSLDENLKNGNSLMFSPDYKSGAREIKNWFDWYQEFKQVKRKSDGFEYVVGNPPWGGNIESEKAVLAKIFPKVSADNLNSFDLFIRQSERLLSKTGTLAFVLPRNFMRTSDYSELRSHIGSKLKFVADAGAAFDGVTQEAVVFGMGQTAQDSFKSYKRLKCYEAGDTKNYLDCTVVPASSVIAPEYVFNFYWTEELGQLFNKQNSTSLIQLKTKIKQSRGIEYGGNGEVGKCPHCSSYISRPKKKKKDYKNCDHCGKKVTLAELPPYNMISKTKTAKHIIPVFSGRDIQKFSCKSPRFLQPKLAGIDYKTSLFDGKPTIFITKISESIRCDIALNGEYVTQGVYTLKSKDKELPLEWIAAVLNSEAVRFFYEFHHNVGAKLTTNVLLDHLLSMRIPKVPDEINEVENAIKSIKKHKLDSDEGQIAMEQIDNIVFEAFGFKKSDIKVVRNFLSEVEELKAVVDIQVKTVSADFGLQELDFDDESDLAS